MTRGRLKILITIMVFELRVPHSSAWSALAPVMSVFFAYILSFVFLGIYWNNHHHMLHGEAGVCGDAFAKPPVSKAWDETYD